MLCTTIRPPEGRAVPGLRSLSRTPMYAGEVGQHHVRIVGQQAVHHVAVRMTALGVVPVADRVQGPPEHRVCLRSTGPARSRPPAWHSLFFGHSEQEEVVPADQFPDLHVGAVERADRERR